MKNTITIVPQKSTFDQINIKEIFAYKDLFYELVLRDIKIRHKQTLLGVAWVIFQPLVSSVIFTIIFGLILKIPSNQLPYPLFVFIGLNFWNFFSTSVTTTSGSLAGNEALIKKVYFPRVLIPLASIATNFFDFMISTIFLVILILIYGVQLDFYALIFYILATMLVLITIIGIGLILSALNVRYRDVRQILPFFIQMLIFLTPVFYPVTVISQKYQWLLALNPVTSAIEVTRGVLLVDFSFNLFNLSVSIFMAIALFLLGLWYFYKTERYFADII